MICFPTKIDSIEKRIKTIDPIKYAATRNYENGSVTYLSPYISRGVISTKQVFEHLKTLNLKWYQVEKLVQELAWRDYWQQIWIEKGNAIKADLKNEQKPVLNHQIHENIVNADIKIDAIDQAIEHFYQTGYMHNHMRMYVASICCNVANSHWLMPAKWMYYHLLDGDLASNHLSWQWVAGAFSNKKYYANQNNINKFFNSDQKNTFLDVEYTAFENFEAPKHLISSIDLELKTVLPNLEKPVLDATKTTLIYNYYNIDLYWYATENVQRVLLLEPSFFEAYPVSKKCIDFVLDLSKNIENIYIFIGEFSELAQSINPENIIYKEHPTNTHYKGKQEPRDWLSSVTGYHSSFFKFWKKSLKELKF